MLSATPKQTRTPISAPFDGSNRPGRFGEPVQISRHHRAASLSASSPASVMNRIPAPNWWSRPSNTRIPQTETSLKTPSKQSRHISPDYHRCWMESLLDGCLLDEIGWLVWRDKKRIQKWLVTIQRSDFAGSLTDQPKTYNHIFLYTHNHNHI